MRKAWFQPWHCRFVSHAGYCTSFEVFDIWPWVKYFQARAFIPFHIVEQKQSVTRDLRTGFSRDCEWRVNCDLKPKLKWTSKRNIVSMGTYGRRILSSDWSGVVRSFQDACISIKYCCYHTDKCHAFVLSRLLSKYEDVSVLLAGHTDICIISSDWKELLFLRLFGWYNVIQNVCVAILQK